LVVEPLLPVLNRILLFSFAHIYDDAVCHAVTGAVATPQIRAVTSQFCARRASTSAVGGDYTQIV